VGGVGADVLLKGYLRETVEGERGHSALQSWRGDAPGAVGAAPASEVVPFGPDHAFITQTATFMCVRLGFELERDEWNTSIERGR
jgi:hypothetical protein